MKSQAEIIKIICDAAEQDADTFYAENKSVFDLKASGEWEVISVREILRQNEIDYRDLPEDFYNNLLETYANLMYRLTNILAKLDK